MATAATDVLECIEMGENAHELKKRAERVESSVDEMEMLIYKEQEVNGRRIEDPKQIIGMASKELIMVIMKMERRNNLGTCEEMIGKLRGLVSELKRKSLEMIEKERSEKEKEELKKQIDELKTLLNKQGNGGERKRTYVRGFGNRIQPRMYCYVCGDEGHKAFNCSKRINKEDRNYFVKKVNNKRIKTNYDFLTLEELKSLYKEKFSLYNGVQRYCEIEKCEIDTPEGVVIRKKGAIIPQALESKAREYLISLERRNIIRKSQSKWRNPVRFIEKENGEVRMVLNLIELNKLVPKENNNLRTIRDIVRATYASKWFTVIDLKEAFYSVEIVEKDKHKTGFEVMGNVYEFNGMVMGFKNSPMILQRIMTVILSDLLGKGVECYLDDIIIHSVDRVSHQKLVIEVLERLNNNHLQINMNKVQYAENTVQILGFKINGDDIIPLEKQKAKIEEFTRPNKIKECRQFLGMCNWFRSFIKDLAVKTYAMTISLRIKDGDKWIWNQKMENEFNNIKR